MSEETKNEGYSYYSAMTVLKSAAGWYIGRRYWDAEMEFWDNGSRESGYFGFEDDANDALDNWDWEYRDCDENDFMYSSNPRLCDPRVMMEESAIAIDLPIYEPN